MKEYRYSTFRLADNLRPLTAICIFVLFSVMSTVLNLSFFFTLVPALLAFLYAWQIMQLHREQFVLRSDLILVFMGRKTHTISLPAKITCVISYADVCTPLDTPASLRGALHTQRNRYAVSILQRMPPASVLEALHRTHAKRYTTIMVKNAFEPHLFIYSFVCNQSMIDILVAGRDCLFILPESLKEQVFIRQEAADVPIDMDY